MGYRGPTEAGCHEVVWLVGSRSRGKAWVAAPGPEPGRTGMPLVPVADGCDGEVPLAGTRCNCCGQAGAVPLAVPGSEGATKLPLVAGGAFGT